MAGNVTCIKGKRDSQHGARERKAQAGIETETETEREMGIRTDEGQVLPGTRHHFLYVVQPRVGHPHEEIVYLELCAAQHSILHQPVAKSFGFIFGQTWRGDGTLRLHCQS